MLMPSVYILFFLCGVICGSLAYFFAGVLIREPRALVVSNCRNCSAKWGYRFLIPVAGYFMAGRKCPKCGTALGMREAAVEIFSGILFVFLLWKYGLTLNLAILILFYFILLLLFITDMEDMLLPNVVTYPALGVAALTALAFMIFNYQPEWSFGFSFSGWVVLLNNNMVNALAGGLSGFIIFFLVVLVSRGGMAYGDVKLATLIGMMTGFPMVFVALFIGIMCGGATALILLLTRRKGRKEFIPFGPFLCIGGMAGLIWGKDILFWYLGL